MSFSAYAKSVVYKSPKKCKSNTELKINAGLFFEKLLILFFTFPSKNQLHAKIIWDTLIKNLDNGKPTTKTISAKI